MFICNALSFDSVVEVSLETATVELPTGKSYERAVVRLVDENGNVTLITCSTAAGRTLKIVLGEELRK